MAELSSEFFARACKVIPAGVNSPVRAFRSVGDTGPFFVERGEGANLFDVDGREYIDYVCSWGPLILGHAHPVVIDAVLRAARGGTSFGAPTLAETSLAKKVVSAVESRFGGRRARPRGVLRPDRLKRPLEGHSIGTFLTEVLDRIRIHP